MLKLFKCYISIKTNSDYYNLCYNRNEIEYIFANNKEEVKCLLNAKYPNATNIDIIEMNISPGLVISLNRYNLILEDNSLDLSANTEKSK